MTNRFLKIFLFAIVVTVVGGFSFFLSKYGKEDSFFSNSYVGTIRRKSKQTLGYSEVLCYSTHSGKHTDRYTVDELEFITPESNLVSDKYKVCIVSNMCIDDSGKILLFLPPTNSSTPSFNRSSIAWPNDNKFFSSDRQFIKKLLIDNIIEGQPSNNPPTRVEILDMHDLERIKKNGTVRMSSKWLHHSIPIFWFNYYHTVVDGYYQAFVTLKQVSNLVSNLFSKGKTVENNLVSPTALFDSAGDLIESRDYELLIVTKYLDWNNRVVNVLEKAFEQPIVADSGEGKNYVCSPKGIIGLSYAFNGNLFESFLNSVIKRPTTAEVQMLKHYISYIKQKYQNSPISKDNSKINILLIRRTKNRVITNLNSVYDYFTRVYGKYVEVQVKENSQHTFEEQLKYHEWADVIMSSHGADETNIFFSNPGAIVIEVESSTHFEPFFQVNSQKLNIRHYLFRGSGADKNSDRVIDMDQFIPFFEAALCYGDSYIGNKLITQTSTQSKYCNYIRSERKLESGEATVFADKYLKERVNPFEQFSKDEKLEEIRGNFLIGCCI